MDEFRRGLAAARNDMDLSMRSLFSKSVCCAIINSKEYQKAKTVFCYMATGSEVDLSELMAHAMRNQKTVLLPRITGKGTMLSCVYDGHLQLGAYGIPEPTGKPCKPDLIICPMLAFNKERYRIGYGGGYYDRYLADSTAVFFGVAFQEQRQKFLAQAHDVPLHRIFTQVGVF